ncbi:MAG: right-handed parallel beta-helix repeat-containing protein, partial [Dokdonella sp.]
MSFFADQRSFRPRLTALAAAIVLATSGAAVARVDRSASLVAAPHSWPLAYERSAQVTPLRSRIDALRISRPAPENHVAANLIVSNCADDGSAGSLRAAVDTAVSGDVIDMTALTCSRISLTNGALDIELDELTLRGPGATQLSIDGNDLDRVIYHPGSDALRIENLTIEHGHYAASGNDIGFGGCIATAADLTLTNSVVRDCTVIGEGAYGGGVLSGLLTMRSSTISGCTAFGDHPVYGTAAYGGGAFSYGVDMLDSTISSNSATAAPNPLSHFEIAGGLFVAHNGGIIERSTISNNYAVRFAGGFTQEGDLILRNSTVSGNSTRDDDGGGIRVRQVTAITIENSTITNNHAGGGGGGISFINFALPSTLQSSIIAGNS